MILKKTFCHSSVFSKCFLKKCLLYHFVSVKKKKTPLKSNWFSLLFLFTSSSCFVLSLCVFSLCLLSSLLLLLLKKFRERKAWKWFLQFSLFLIFCCDVLFISLFLSFFHSSFFLSSFSLIISSFHLFVHSFLLLSHRFLHRRFCVSSSCFTAIFFSLFWSWSHLSCLTSCLLF